MRFCSLCCFLTGLQQVVFPSADSCNFRADNVPAIRAVRDAPLPIPLQDKYSGVVHNPFMGYMNCCLFLVKNCSASVYSFPVTALKSPE